MPPTIVVGMARQEGYERVEISAASELREWLLSNHAQDDGVWLVTYKAHSDRYVSRSEVLDELLCFGWIDGRRMVLDEERTMQLISPRRTQYWAKSYKQRVAELASEGRMHESGVRSVEEGKRSGLWSFMDDVDALIVPDDLEGALVDAAALAAFESLAPSYRRNVLRWIKLAKRPETRVDRISRTAEATASGERIPQM